MSMILDALARAEREREKNDIASNTQFSFDSDTYAKKQKFAMWVVGALLVNALVISAVLVIKPWESKEEIVDAVANQASVSTIDSKQESLAVNSEEDTSVTAAPSTKPLKSVDDNSANKLKSEAGSTAQQHAAEIEQLQSVSDLSQQAAIKKSGIAVKTKPRIEKNPPVRYATAPINSTTVKEQPVVDETKAVRDYKRLQDLSGAIKTQLSQYEVNVHVYDKDPNRSFVLVNMTRLKNGDQIPGGPTVERIVPEGVIFQYQGERVLIERN